MPSLDTVGRIAALLSLALAASPAAAADVTLGDIVVHRPWTRATPGGAQVGGGYVTIENRGTAPERLTGGSFAGSDGFELHTMTSDGGVMRMRPSGPVENPPGRSVALAPSGTHIMFTGLKRGLKRGETVPGTLTFEHAGTARVDYSVEGIGAKAPDGEAAPAHPGHAMPGMD